MTTPTVRWPHSISRHFIGESPAFVACAQLLIRYAASRAPVLVIGETGTGKELAAHALHYASDRCDRPFVPVNCGALPDGLIESELFGHAKGAFTDAGRGRSGLVREAEGGTLFLDEIEALSRRGQVILLRFLQDASFRAVGEESRRSADVRVVAASNVPLDDLADRGEFRRDLLFRLDVLTVELPPLRSRTNDVPALARHLLVKAARSEGGEVKRLSPAAISRLMAYRWPGNVRELEHVMLRAHLLTSDPVIHEEDLLASSPALRKIEPGRRDTCSEYLALRELKRQAADEVERRFVEEALARAGNLSQAARLCHMERAAFSKLAKKVRAGKSAA